MSGDTTTAAAASTPSPMIVVRRDELPVTGFAREFEGVRHGGVECRSS